MDLSGGSKTLNNQRILIDKVVSTEFQPIAIDDLCGFFSDDEKIISYLESLRVSENLIDLKRGELYPELLRSLYNLRKIAAKLYDINIAQVQANFGSNGSIDTILTAVKLGECKSKSSNAEQLPQENIKSYGGVLFATPGYFRNYNSAESKNLTIHKVPLDEQFEFPVKDFISKMLCIHPSLVILVTPNNPTGVPISDKHIIEVLDNVSNDSWVMIDRTLANTEPEISTMDILHNYNNKNIVVLHSFSKYKSMSHHRIGLALYSNPEMAMKVQPLLPLGLSFEAVIKALRILRNENGLFPSQKLLNNIISNKRILKEFIKQKKGWFLCDFTSNYCLIQLPQGVRSQNICESLENNGLHVLGGHDFPDVDERLIRIHTASSPYYINTMCSILGNKTFS